MPEIDFLNKKTFTKTSGMINLRPFQVLCKR